MLFNKLVNLLQLTQQPHIAPPTRSQFRDLVWGDLNFVHTTDTHGWYAGHLNQKQYSADWGDFVSFTTHLREYADSLGSDLLLIDTGDKHDGNGLSDSTYPNGINSTTVFNYQDYDLLTLGNHELYTEEATKLEHDVTKQIYKEKYVTSNVEFRHNTSSEFKPLGSRFRYFTTKNQQKRVLALSFMFDFTRFNDHSRVIPIKESIRQDWFKELTATYKESDIDLLIVFGHIPVNDLDNDELLSLHIALRRIYPNLVIQYFGGHSHIRDFSSFDMKSTGLQSGRYCETVGFLSINTTLIENEDYSAFNRRYIDFNRESFMHHSKTGKHSFDTHKGIAISKEITQLRADLNLTTSFGYVPRNYMMNEYPHGDKRSLYTLLNSTILPTLKNTIGRDDTEFDRIILINSGGIRYDLFKGNYTKDTGYIVSPFENDWDFISIPRSIAMKLNDYLNRQDFFLPLSSPEDVHFNLKQQRISLMTSIDTVGNKECEFISKPHLKKGYVTSDQFGCDGDDVLHNSIPFYQSPNVIQTYQELSSSNGATNKDKVDVVFYSFIKPYILEAINKLNTFDDKIYTSSDVSFYGGESTGTLLKNYISEHWSSLQRV